MTEKDSSSVVEATKKAPPVVKADDYKTIYCNASKFSVTPWDIRFSVGQIVDDTKGVTVNEEKITVVMAPSHAKAVLKNLAATVGAYEEAFGEIADISAIQKRQKKPTQAEESSADLLTALKMILNEPWRPGGMSESVADYARAAIAAHEAAKAQELGETYEAIAAAEAELNGVRRKWKEEEAAHEAAKAPPVSADVEAMARDLESVALPLNYVPGPSFKWQELMRPAAAMLRSLDARIAELERLLQAEFGAPWIASEEKK